MPRGRVRSWRDAFVRRDVFDELAVSEHRDGCSHETGYPATILREVFDRYSSQIFDSEHATASGYGRATRDEVYFFLMYKYIHVSCP